MQAAGEALKAGKAVAEGAIDAAGGVRILEAGIDSPVSSTLFSAFLRQTSVNYDAGLREVVPKR